MQSGISASNELHEAFTNFLSDSTSFCLPVTITNEQLVPLSPVSFSGTNKGEDDSAFFSSLPSLSSVLQPQTPVYLLLRRPSTAGLVAVTYVPSNSPVRSKTLFASTRATVVRELGSEKFADNVFAVEEGEVLDVSEWKERDADKMTSRGAGEDEDEKRREEVMSEQEKELRLLKKQEIQALTMSQRRDIGMGGGNNGEVGSTRGIPSVLGGDIVEALLETQREEGSFVVLTIDVATEAFTLALKQSNVSPADVPGLISDTKPQYTFYRYPNSQALIFVYTCPPGCSIKERMLNASSRRSVMAHTQSEGVNITHKIEASGSDEVTQQRLEEEVNPPKQEAPSRGFARPKRPGR